MTDSLTDLQSLVKDKLLTQLMTTHKDGVSSFLQGENIVQEAASHDFTAYEFLYDPITEEPQSTLFTQHELDLLMAHLEVQVGRNLDDTYGEAVSDGTGGADYDLWSRNEFSTRTDFALARRLYDQVFLEQQLPLLAPILPRLNSDRRAETVESLIDELAEMIGGRLKTGIEPVQSSTTSGLSIQAFDTQFRRIIIDRSFWKTTTEALVERMLNNPEVLKGGDARTQTFGHAAFTAFEAGTINFGLQLVYRQVWTPLGTQTGEIVRTIPLGPGQTEKISIKTVSKQTRRQESTRQSDRETSNDSTSTTRDSSEVVTDASERFNWGVEATASAKWGWGDASVSGSLSGEKSKESRDTKSNLNESMSKSADKLRVQTKVLVSTQTEEESETSRVSEIKNTNDEVAVTYVYSKLQRRYQIHTYLAELNTVIYVAAPLPKKVELTARWFARHAHILRPVLLDDSYLADLNLIVANPPRPSGASTAHRHGQADQNLSKIIGTLAARGLPDFAQAPGSPPDQTSSALSMYEREIERVREVDDMSMRSAAALERLSDHVADHALHYGRALWEAEDPDVRIMRYKNIKVPAKWRFIRNIGDYRPGNRRITGGYVPTDDNPDNMISLSDLINPAGPIGYAGNYLAFNTRNMSRYPDLDQPLRAMRTAFLTRTVMMKDAAGTDLDVIASVQPTWTLPAAGLPFTVSRVISADETPMYRMSYANGFKDIPVDPSTPVLKFPTLKLLLTNGGTLHDLLATEGAVLSGHVHLSPKLEDPELSELKWRLLPLPEAEAAPIFTSDVISDMTGKMQKRLLNRHTVDDLTAMGKTWAELSPELQKSFCALYPAYILAQRYTRDILLDTDNLVLSRVVDDTSSIEPFKALHRYIDVLGAIEDLSARSQETQRLRDRLAAGDLSDPDIESHKVIVTDPDTISVDT